MYEAKVMITVPTKKSLCAALVSHNKDMCMYSVHFGRHFDTVLACQLSRPWGTVAQLVEWRTLQSEDLDSNSH